MDKKNIDNIIDKLSSNIADDVGNMHSSELQTIANSFDKTLIDALRAFNASTFDNDGFIKKMRDIDLGNKHDQDMMKNVLNTIRSDYVNVESINQSELLLRRDLQNICTQMPEMRDVIYVIRDGIIECNVSTGEVSRSIIFENREDTEAYETQVKEIEERHDLLMAIKNFIVPRALTSGEMYVHIIPDAKLFAELEALRNNRQPNVRNMNTTGYGFQESIPNEIYESFKESVSLYSDNNLELLMESAANITKVDTSDIYKIDREVRGNINEDSIAKENITRLLNSIDIYNGSSVLLSEMGEDGLRDLLMREYAENAPKKKTTKETHFAEAMNFNRGDSGLFGSIDQDFININNYNDIKGCHIKYLDSLRMIPIRMDRRVIGYYYVTTTMDLQTNSANPNGIIDLSFQNYTRDRNFVGSLANMIIQSFDKKMLEKNIKLKNEIAEIIMAHKFSEGKLSFIYIPENEIVRFVINEDEEGRGHSAIEPTMFPARIYLMLTAYNVLYTLNNNTTRIHYLKSSGLNKDYAAQVQRAMRKFQSRRITIDDIYSYSGVLNKVGGMGEMVLPAGRGDYKAFETDTIEAVQNPINMEFLEQKRREAISGTGVPHLMMINAIDEADFAKTLEMANTRYLSTVSSYKIDFNKGLTKLYRMILKYSTDMEDDEINSFRFQFNTVKQQELVITSEMINNFESTLNMVMSIFYKKSEMEDDKGNPTMKQMNLRKELAKIYLPQLEFDKLSELVKAVDLASVDDELNQRAANADISDSDVAIVTGK